MDLFELYFIVGVLEGGFAIVVGLFTYMYWECGILTYFNVFVIIRCWYGLIIGYYV